MSSIANSAPILSPAPTSSGSPPSPSTTHSGIVASFTARRHLSRPSLAASKFFSRASRMPMSSCVSTLGPISIGPAFEPTKATVNVADDGRKTVVRQPRLRVTAGIAATMNRAVVKRCPQDRITLFGQSRSRSPFGKNSRSLLSWTTSCETRTEGWITG